MIKLLDLVLALDEVRKLMGRVPIFGILIPPPDNHARVEEVLIEDIIDHDSDADVLENTMGIVKVTKKIGIYGILHLFIFCPL